MGEVGPVGRANQMEREGEGGSQSLFVRTLERSMALTVEAVCRHGGRQNKPRRRVDEGGCRCVRACRLSEENPREPLTSEGSRLDDISTLGDFKHLL